MVKFLIIVKGNAFAQPSPKVLTFMYPHDFQGSQIKNYINKRNVCWTTFLYMSHTWNMFPWFGDRTKHTQLSWEQVMKNVNSIELHKEELHEQNVNQLQCLG
jgi:hypothetical protein